MSDAPNQDTQLAPWDVIRVETALARYPLHRLAKQGIIPIEIREIDAHGDLSLNWKVTYNSEYGQPGPLAYQLDTLVINRHIEAAGKPIPKLIKIGSLGAICRTLGLVEGGKIKNEIKYALFQNASAFITAKLKYKTVDGAERSIEIGDTRYGVIFTGERLPDGRVADAVYIVLHDFYREILDHALTRPLDYNYLRELPPAAQRLYELVSFPMFGALQHGRSRVKFSYSEFCRYAPLTRHLEARLCGKQMRTAYAPHQQSGYFAQVTFAARTDHEGKPDWLMFFTPGPKAKAEFRAFTRKGGPAALEALPEPEPTSLERELVERGVSPKVAVELVRDFSGELIKSKISHIDWINKKEQSKVRDMGAYLTEAIRQNFAPPAGFQDHKAKEPELDDATRQIKERQRDERAEIETYWQSLTSEQQYQLDDEAAKKADPDIRADLHHSLPERRRLARSRCRVALIRDRLGLPRSPETEAKSDTQEPA